LEAVARSTGEFPAELELPAIPFGCLGLWNTFIELHNARQNTGLGMGALSLGDLVAWQALHRVELNPWEVETLQILDRVAVKAHAEKAKS
jgi:hypothetical protein